VTAVTPAVHDARLGLRATAGQAAALARRSIVRIMRQPQVIVPNLFFPTFFLVINNASVGKAAGLPGFPGDRYLPFALAGTVLQAVMLSSTSAGSEVALDIESGFFERMLASPVNRLAILLGQLAGVAVFGALLALFFAAVIAPFDAVMKAGIGGYVVLVISAVFLAVTFGGFALALGIRTGSVEATQGAFPLYFVAIFISSAFFPVALMTPWYRHLAGNNPVTFMIDGIRDLTLEPFSWAAAANAIGVSFGAALVAVLVAFAALNARLAQR